jgi:hypothetical protein
MADRPASAELVRAWVKRITRELTQQATQIGASPELWRVTGEHPKHHGPTTQVSLPVPSRRGPLVAALGFFVVAALGGAWLLGRRPSPRTVEPVVIAPLPPEPAPPPVLAPVPALPPEPVRAPEAPAVVPRSVVKSAPAKSVSPKTLQELIARLEQTLKSRTPAGEEPNAEALAFLNRKKLELTQPSAGERLGEISRYLDQWEKNYLR